MKKAFYLIALVFVSLLVVGCVPETETKDENGNTKKEFSIAETAYVNDTKIKVNSVRKVNNECSWEYEGVCKSYNNPDNAFFLIIDVTIENTGSEELSISSLVSFDLKDSTGEKGKYAFMTKEISSQLDGSVMAGDLLKGQIAYDVKDSDKYYFYYSDSLVDDSIKFIINKSDITE